MSLKFDIFGYRDCNFYFELVLKTMATIQCHEFQGIRIQPVTLDLLNHQTHFPKILFIVYLKI